jgi:hemerythrin-like domain-containing protein
MDIFTLLKNDHKEVKDLFQKILNEEEINTEWVETLCQKLTIHMDLEEKLFYPVLGDHEETSELAEEAGLEHAEAKKIVRALKKEGLENSELKVKCEMLKLAIEHHVDEEEGEIFPKAKQTLTHEQINSIGTEFAKQKEKRLARVVN